jgi:hypothetical protein
MACLALASEYWLVEEQHWFIPLLDLHLSPSTNTRTRLVRLFPIHMDLMGLEKIKKKFELFEI